MKASDFDSISTSDEFVIYQDYYSGFSPSSNNPASNGSYEYEVVINPTTTQREIRIRRRNNAGRYI